MATLIHPGEGTFVDASRFECVDGQLLERPSPNADHSTLQLAVVVLLRPQAKQVNHKARQEWSINRNESAKREWLTPDVLVVSNQVKRAENGHALPPALLAVEVLSPGQTFTQMRETTLICFSWGVEHVWVIDPKSHSAMTFSRTEPNEGRLVFEGVLRADLAGSDSPGELQISLKDIFEFS